MSWQGVAREALVGALGGLVVVVGFVIIRATLDGVTDADWLAFGGALAGTGLAVAGAVWIESWKRGKERKGEANAVLGAIIRIRATANTMLGDRPEQMSEPEWQAVIAQMPENIATYSKRLDRALDRLTTATTDGDILEAGDMVLRASSRLERCISTGDPDQAPQVVDALQLLTESCEVAQEMLESRISYGRPITFAEAIKGRGRRLN